MSYQHQVLGTIVSSVLNYDQFCSTMDERPAIDNRRSSYVPCDGRSIVGSALERLTQVGPTQPDPRNHIIASPDLRGKFQRGLNSFYDVGQPDFDISFGDPEGVNRKVSSFQNDGIRSHNHPVIDNSQSFAFQTPGMGITSDRGTQVRFGKPNIAVGETGELETRPKNIAVYFYIKIN